MSTSPPQSPVEDIQIDTPPPSPTSLNLDLHVTPNARATEVVDITPSRRQKKPQLPLRNKRQRVASLELPDEISGSQVHPTDDPFFNDIFAAGDLQNSQASGQDDTYGHYLELVLADCVGFYQITNTIFVVQGWDTRGNAGTSRWHHLQRKQIGDEWVVVCFCPSGGNCVHERLAMDVDMDQFLDDDLFHKDDDEVILFSRQPAEDGDTYSNIFSVTFTGQTSVKSRVIVSHLGDDDGTGTWTCAKDRGIHCGHITSARHELQRLVRVDPTATDGALHEEATECVVPVRVRSAIKSPDNAISHLPVRPPLWASLPDDPLTYPRAQPLHAVPGILELNNVSRCCCFPIRSAYSPLRPFEHHSCTIYTLTGAHCTRIELQSCPSCPRTLRRFIGPETRDLGVFNFNNRILFTHDLLDEYTSAYTSSETPFVGWVATVSRRYTNHGSERPFVTEKMFRAVWFSYIQLQHLETVLQCHACGPMPQDTIWDGVTLAFSQKHLLPSLRPPTISHENSLHRDEVRYYSHMQWLPDQKLRKAIRKVIQGRSLILQSDDEDDEANDSQTRSSMTEKSQQDLLDRIKTIPGVQDDLGKFDQSLKDVFSAYFGIQALGAGIEPPGVYRRLLVQLSAEESVLQTANRPSLEALRGFVTHPTSINASRLVGIPCLYEVLEYHKSKGEGYPGHLLSLCKWMCQRGESLLKGIIVHQAPSTDESAHLANHDWKKTGCSYTMPQVRHRPQYRYLKHDLRSEPGGRRGAKCSKYYSKYGEQRLTGGIMCVWCTHSVCYGFHCIPRGEGRNDVFSALLTRWPKAPKTVVYDFACALGPYCMTREPDFFADTLFAIDSFHAKGHTKCAPAAFLSTYANVDPRLARINSSAAECGNGGLNRIRKSVSYMSQDRAIIYTKVFLSIWNRLRVRKMKGIDA